jgi:hypothetical protein
MTHAEREERDWRIYADFAQLLMAEARALYANNEDLGLALDQTAFALDSTIIDLCLFYREHGSRRRHGIDVCCLVLTADR